MQAKRKKLTDMLLDDRILKETYDERYDEYTQKINHIRQEQKILTLNVDAKKDVGRRMKDLRARISEVNILDNFERTVFESIVKKVMVGEINEDGISDPYKITFVLKGRADYSVSDTKKRYKNLSKQVI